MESDVLKAVEEISGYTPDEMLDMYNDYGRMAKEWEAYAGTGLTPEEVAHAKDLLAAERDGKLYTAHDVAVILASTIGDDCACNINSIFVNTDARNTESVVSLKTCKSDAIPFWTN